MTITKRAKSRKTKRLAKRSRCPVCFQGWLEPTLHTDSYVHEVGGVTKTVVVENMPVEACTSCGETFHGPEAGHLHQLAICKAFGFLTPQEIVDLRENILGLSQDELARLTGASVEKIADVERGRTVQDRPLDRLLRLLKENPSTLADLKRIAGFGDDDEPAARKPRRYLEL